MAGPGVVRRIDLLEVALADAADIAQHVRGLHVVRIVTQQLRLDVDAGKAMPVDSELRGLILAQIDPMGTLSKRRRRFLSCQKRSRSFVRSRSPLKARPGPIEVVDLFRRDLQAVGRGGSVPAARPVRS